jgi:hypothetical protein
MSTTSFSLLPEFFNLTLHVDEKNEQRAQKEQPHEYLLHSIVDTLCGHGPGVSLKQLVQLDSENTQSTNLIQVENILTATKAFILRVLSLNLNQEQVQT